MKVGDLVYLYLDFHHEYLGIITKIQHQMDTEAFFVKFFDRSEYDDWYGDLELEAASCK